MNAGFLNDSREAWMAEFTSISRVIISVIKLYWKTNMCLLHTLVYLEESKIC